MMPRTGHQPVNVVYRIVYWGVDSRLRPRDQIFSQFSIDCCQNAFASGALPGRRWGAYSTLRPPAGKSSVTHRSYASDTFTPSYSPGLCSKRRHANGNNSYEDGAMRNESEPTRTAEKKKVAMVRKKKL